MSTPAIGISRSEQGDLPALIGLLSAADLPLTGAEGAEFFVAHRDGTIVGCAGLETYGVHGLLRSVVVAEPCRRSGIATRLVNEVVRHARSSRLSDLYLLTETAPDFFRLLGFAAFPRPDAPRAVADSWEFRVGCADSAVPMLLRL